MIAWAMRDQVVKPRDAFRHVRTMPRRNPPQHQRGLDRYEEFFAADKEAPVQGLPDKALQRFHAFPHRQVRQDGRVVIDTHVHRVSALVLQPPDEAFDLVRETMYPVHVLDELAHARIIERITDPRDDRSEEHTSELQSLRHLVCRLLLEKKKDPLREGLVAL